MEQKIQNRSCALRDVEDCSISSKHAALVVAESELEHGREKREAVDYSSLPIPHCL